MIVSPNSESAVAGASLRGFARTVAEVEWLLLVLVMLYQLVMVPDHANAEALSLAMVLFATFVLGFHYLNFYREESRWKIAVETWVMIVFITWVLMHTGRLDSPLLYLYVLVIITSALTLGKLATGLQIALIAACYVWLGYGERTAAVSFASFLAGLGAQLAPMLLVGYVTTMLASDMQLALAQIKTLSETDDLTGIFNRRAVTIISERTFKQAARYSRPCSVLMIDSDSLKRVNDSYGHEAGNRLLKLTVDCIRSQLRDADLVARYGGDEFLVLLPETPCSGAAAVAGKIREKIESTPLPVADKNVSITASIGVACYPDHGSDFDAVLKRADQAMYGSKKHGRNLVTVYSSEFATV